jgi:hypothetical protein
MNRIVLAVRNHLTGVDKDTQISYFRYLDIAKGNGAVISEKNLRQELTWANEGKAVVLDYDDMSDIIDMWRSSRGIKVPLDEMV